MIDIKTDQLEQRIDRAIKSMRHDESHKLISITKQIEQVSPLLVFEGAGAFRDDRTFWSSADRTLTLTSVGKIKIIEASQNRFTETEKAWQSLIKNAWIDNPYEGTPGTGIVALGGMSFDPLKETTELWSKFAPSLFYIPNILLTVYEDNYYVTTNMIVSKKYKADSLADLITQKEIEYLSGSHLPQQKLSIEKEIEIDPQKWQETVAKAAEEMKQSTTEKIVLAREVRLHFDEEVNIAYVLSQLMNTQQHSYLFAFENNGDCFVGATPERLVKVEGSDLLSTCLAGTAPRGATEKEDREIGQTLLNDEKNRKEHDFVVQMINNALLKTCTDISIPEKPVLHPLKNLQHLYTPVTAKLKQNFTIFDVVEQLHPTPALGGTPTKESLKFIREHEQLDRGWYGAPIGWIDSNNNGEFAVAIRSALIQRDEASLFAGCGILADSDNKMEYEETKIKLMPMLTVLGGHNESH